MADGAVGAGAVVVGMTDHEQGGRDESGYSKKQRPQKGMTVVNHVLGKFSEDDYATILHTLDKVETALNHYLKTNDFEDTMRRYNG